MSETIRTDGSGVMDAESRVFTQNDLISRQAAISEANKNGAYGYISAEELARLPSAQPEPLTDSEQRIFLKAISREKEVCKKTDEEFSGALNLVCICNEIERKVKGALWT